MNLYAKILRNIAPELRIRDCGCSLLEAQLANAKQTIKQLETMVPDPRCASKGCKNIVESGEDWCTNCLDDMS